MKTQSARGEFRWNDSRSRKRKMVSGLAAAEGEWGARQQWW